MEVRCHDSMDKGGTVDQRISCFGLSGTKHMDGRVGSARANGWD